MTTIVGNTITTGYITALGLVVGTEIGLGTAEDAAGVTTIVGNTITTGYVDALEITAVGAVTAGSLTGLTVQTAVAGQRVVIDGPDNKISLFTGAGAGTEVLIIDDNIGGPASWPGIKIADASKGAIVLLYKDGSNLSRLTHNTLEMYTTSAGGLAFRVQADGDIDVGKNIIVAGVVDGRNINTDGTKLDTIDTNADVTANNPPQSHSIASHSTKVAHDDMVQTYPTQTLQIQDIVTGNPWNWTIEDGVITALEEIT